MTSEIAIKWDPDVKKVTKVEFNGLGFFKKIKFEGIGDLNVITGPNGVGKSRLLNAIYEELITEKRRAEKIFPVYFTFSNENVKIKYVNDKYDYDKKIKENKNYHEGFQKRCYDLLINNQKDESADKHKKKSDRYGTIYNKKYEINNQIELQMQYELGMSSYDMFDEISILKYLWKHRLIKFGENYDKNYEDAIDINGHLNDNDFKYSITIPVQYTTISESESKDADELRAIDFGFKDKLNKDETTSFHLLSSGERIYFNLLLWDLIHKVNINLKSSDPDHKGLVKNGGNYVFLLGKFL